MTFKRKLYIGLVILAAAIVGGGLWFLSGRSIANPQQLAGTDWKAVSVNGSGLVDGSYISLYFLDKQTISGYSGVNYCGGNYSSKAPDLKISNLSMTLLLGPYPKINEQERTYQHYLVDAASYRIDGNQLKIYDAANQQLLVFERIPDYQMNPADLVGTSWQLVTANGANVTERHFTTLIFDKSGGSANGTANGYDGTFDYKFSYQASGDNIVVTLNMVERISDLPPDAGYDFFGLTGITKYRFTQGRLELLTYKGETFVFKPLK